MLCLRAEVASEARSLVVLGERPAADVVDQGPVDADECAGDDPGLYGMRRIRAEHPSHPYAELGWPIGQGIGYCETFVSQAVDLVRGWSSGAWTPSFADGLAVQAVCDAMERSAGEKRWVSVAEITGDPAEPPGPPIKT